MQDHRSEAGLMGWEGWSTGSNDLIRTPYSDQEGRSEECVAAYTQLVGNLLES